MADLSFEPTFDQLMQQHEMGQAYKAITEAMGTSPQLMAFVNYGNVSETDNFGLESFNLIGQHQQILAEIDADPSFDMALEMLGAELEAHAGKDADSIATEGFLSKLFGSKVPAYAAFKHYKAYHELNVVCEKDIIDHIPTGFSLKDWNHYLESVVEPAWNKFNKAGVELTAEANQFGQDYSDTNFDDSGWNKVNYEDARSWLDKKNKEADALVEKNKEKLEKIKIFVEKDAKSAPDGKAVVKLIRQAIHMDPGADNLRFLLRQCETMLNKVGKKIK